MDIITLNYMAAQKQQMLETLRTQKGKPNAIITRNDLIMYQDLSPNSGDYEFLWNVQENGDKSNQDLLGTNDYFWPTHIAMAIQKYDSSKTKGWAGTPLYNYVDENIFGNAGEAEALRALFRSKLSFNVDTTEMGSKIATHHLMHRPEVQYETAATTTQAIQRPAYGPSMEKRGYFELHQDLMYHGDDTGNKNVLDVSKEDTSGIEGDTSGNMRNRVWLFVHGWRYHHSFTKSSDKQVCLSRQF